MPICRIHKAALQDGINLKSHALCRHEQMCEPVCTCNFDSFGCSLDGNHKEYEHIHGLFMSPTSICLIEGMVPVLSTDALAIMGDILFPSPAYIEEEFSYSSKHDMDWARKKNKMYCMSS
jgi:hypothetical protein